VIAGELGDYDGQLGTLQRVPIRLGQLAAELIRRSPRSRHVINDWKRDHAVGPYRDFAIELGGKSAVRIEYACTASSLKACYAVIFNDYPFGSTSEVEHDALFAGLHDLFLIGPWNVMREFALLLRQKFSHYVCENPKLHFSAGITLHKPHVPVDLLAEESEAALLEAKGAGKDRVSMFGQVATWEEFEDLLAIEAELSRWLDEFLSRGALYRLNDLCSLAAEEERLSVLGVVSWHRLQCVKWPAFLRYFLVRNMRRGLGETWETQYQIVVTKLYEWLVKYRGRFVLALWPLLYNTRKQRL
jgi:hypothetical protein